MPFRPKFKVVTITADYTVVPADTETLFVAGSGADIEFTLPAIASGKDAQFEFVNPQDFEMLISSAEGENVVALNNATADGISFTTANEHIGCALRVVGDGTKWYAFNMSDGLQTVTVIDA